MPHKIMCVGVAGMKWESCGVPKGDMSEYPYARRAFRNLGGGNNHSLGSVSSVRSSYEVITHLL